MFLLFGFSFPFRSSCLIEFLGSSIHSSACAGWFSRYFFLCSCQPFHVGLRDGVLSAPTFGFGVSPGKALSTGYRHRGHAVDFLALSWCDFPPSLVGLFSYCSDGLSLECTKLKRILFFLVCGSYWRLWLCLFFLTFRCFYCY